MLRPLVSSAAAAVSAYCFSQLMRPDPELAFAAFGEEDLYFGSVIVRLAPVDGATSVLQPRSALDEKSAPHEHDDDHECVGAVLLEDASNIELQAAARKRVRPLSGLGDEYRNVVVPAMPCSDLDIRAARLVVQPPQQLREPLMKHPYGRFIAVQSGVRSAILRCEDGAAYRLKGCGNNYEAFPIRPLLISSDPKFAELLNARGSAFVHTATRELYMTQTINQIFSASQYRCANQAIGLSPAFCRTLCSPRCHHLLRLVGV